MASNNKTLFQAKLATLPDEWFSYVHCCTFITEVLKISEM